MSALFAFLHHLAAFALVAALAVQLVLLRGELTLDGARKLRRADAMYGASAGLLVVVGLLRVFQFEKGAGYYFQSAPFLAKLTLFVLVGLLSIYPTLELRKWAASLKADTLPQVDPARLVALRKVVHWELAGVVAILLCAALMARGIGYFGR